MKHGFRELTRRIFQPAPDEEPLRLPVAFWVFVFAIVVVAGLNFCSCGGPL